jgi:RNA polymerase sigma-70 factor (ECF subfamily)
VKGNKLALQEAEKLNLKDNHFYYLLLSKLSEDLDIKKSIIYLEKALKLCKTETEKIFIKNKIERYTTKLS